MGGGVAGERGDQLKRTRLRRMTVEYRFLVAIEIRSWIAGEEEERKSNGEQFGTVMVVVVAAAAAVQCSAVQFSSQLRCYSVRLDMLSL